MMVQQSLSCPSVLTAQHFSNDQWGLPLYVTDLYTCHLFQARSGPTSRIRNAGRRLIYAMFPYSNRESWLSIYSSSAEYVQSCFKTWASISFITSAPSNVSFFGMIPAGNRHSPFSPFLDFSTSRFKTAIARCVIAA
jgi:hypothetical protein